MIENGQVYAFSLYFGGLTDYIIQWLLALDRILESTLIAMLCGKVNVSW